MKKCSILLLSVIFLVLFAIPVHAASFSLSAGTKQVTPGSSFSIRVGGDAIGRVNLSVTNGTLSTSSVWVEQNYVTVNVTAGQSGTVIVTATPVVGFSDADANLYNLIILQTQNQVLAIQNLIQEHPSQRNLAIMIYHL